LNGKLAVVTGAAQGIGRASAIALARFGADVAVCDRDADNLASAVAEVQALGRRAVSGVVDVRSPDDVAHFMQDVGRTFEHLDVLVNNAGGTFQSPFLDVRPRGHTALVDENFTSVTLFTRAALTLMTEGGSIINLTSIEAHRAGPEFAIYSAQKAAVANLTKSLSLELGARRIRVNCIAPDLIPTPGEGGMIPPEHREGPPKTPLARKAEIDDVASIVIFLASDLARFVTGSTIHVDGGNVAAGGWRRTAEGGFAP
jgi:NAD(P)-dependent dehydrogenase (short-subunit alcohol dehydrogenase family)